MAELRCARSSRISEPSLVVNAATSLRFFMSIDFSFVLVPLLVLVLEFFPWTRRILIQKLSGVPKIFDQSICPIKTPATIKTIAAQNVGVIGSPKVKCTHVVVVRGIKLLNNITWLVRQWRSAEFHSAYGTTPPKRMHKPCTPRCGASTTRPRRATSIRPKGSRQTPDSHIALAAICTPGILAERIRL